MPDHLKYSLLIVWPSYHRYSTCVQDLGIFSTSTLHCIKASTSRPSTAKAAEKMKELDLASLPPTKATGQLSPPPSSVEGT